MKIFELFEMAAPRETDKAKVYYHGTTSDKAAEGIIANGLDPAVTEIKYETRPSHAAKPQRNHIYLTPHISYALIYALGGDMAGSDISRWVEKEGRFGYVFEVPGQNLRDISPDEDSLASILYSVKNGDTNPTALELRNVARRVLTDHAFKTISSGDMVSATYKAAKKLAAALSDDLRLRVIDLPNVHVAHNGRIKPSKCWKIDKLKSPILKRDGSNFFEYAEQVAL